jgi:16S rRNA (adenine1518-N6/adenine1519-N6)-dimethyltransferase
MVSIRKELAEYGLIPKKKLGQHFLTDRNILRKVIREAHVEDEDVILEVGPGLGEMTLELARQGKKVIAIEVDPKLVQVLNKKIADYPNVEVIQADVLKVDFRQIRGHVEGPMKVVANLPYQISTPLLFRFLESREVFSALTLMLQKEVADRIVSPPGRKEYGPLSIFVQLVSDVSVRFFIKPTAFFPPPKVGSAVIHVVWRKKPVVELQDEEWFKAVVRGVFAYRRKTLINALRHSGLSLPEEMSGRIERLEIDPRRRPETLTIQEFGRLAEALRI